MPRGGRRAGSGRKPGNAATKSREYANALAASPDLSPLEYMVGVLRDPEASQQRRDTFAIASAPFCHPKLGAIATLDGAAKLTNIAAVYVVSVPAQMFLSAEQADREYRFRHDIEGATVTPLWQSKDVDPHRGLKLVEDSPGAPREPDGTPAEPPIVDDEVA